MIPSNEYISLYKGSLKEAKSVFGKNYTCKLGIAPDGEEFEVAVIPRENAKDEDWDNIRVCLTQFPATFMHAYLRKGENRVLLIGTRSGGIKDLWGMVEPIINLIAECHIGFTSYSIEERYRAKLVLPVKIAEELGLPNEKPFRSKVGLYEWAEVNIPENMRDKMKVVDIEASHG